MGKIFFVSAWLLLFITGLNGTEQEGTCFDGQIMECSPLSDPRKSNYPDCYFTVSVKVNNILKGSLLPRQIKLVVPGFVEYKNTSYANWKVGMMLRVWVIPFDMLEESKRTIQQVDTLKAFDLESFFLIKGEIISKLSEPRTIEFSDTIRYDSRFLNPLRRCQGITGTLYHNYKFKCQQIQLHLFLDYS